MDPSEKRPAQLRQDKVKSEIIVNGSSDWRPHLDRQIHLSDEPWIKWCGGTDVPLLKYLEIEAWANDVSFERCVLNTLLDHGYTLEELEVTFSELPRSFWGKCVWYKDHPLYAKPLGKMFRTLDPKWNGFVRSMFKTEHNGDKEFTLFSMQMASASILGMPEGILLHKTLIFHKAILSSPKAAQQAA